MRRSVVVTALLLLVTPAVVAAQGSACQVPAELAAPRPDGPSASTPVRAIPTASYTLALSWSPQYCREQDGRRDTPAQCTSAEQFGLTLHGLWPDGAGEDWPQYCRTVPLLPMTTIRANYCATPSAQLQQHEWAKHGSCMNISADAYFRRSIGLYRALNLPDLRALSRRPGLTVGQLQAMLARANPELPPAAIRVTLKDNHWLDELWLCLDLKFRYARCRASQEGGVTANTPLEIWRGPPA